MEGSNHGKRKTLRGYVTPAAWDDCDACTQLFITTEEGEDYLVADNELVDDLKHCIDTEVEAEGLVFEDAEANRCIRVLKYRVVRG